MCVGFNNPIISTQYVIRWTGLVLRSLPYLLDYQVLLFIGTECGVYGTVSEYITILSTTELATCNAQNSSLNGKICPISSCYFLQNKMSSKAFVRCVPQFCAMDPLKRLNIWSHTIMNLCRVIRYNLLLVSVSPKETYLNIFSLNIHHCFYHNSQSILDVA